MFLLGERDSAIKLLGPTELVLDSKRVVGLWAVFGTCSWKEAAFAITKSKRGPVVR